MNCDEYINSLKADYHTVRLLSKKNNSTVLLLRHKELNNSIVLRKYETPIKAYDYLKTVKNKNLPEVYDTYRFDDGQIVLEEYINGISVADVLENGLYTYKGAKAVVTGVCSALSLLHAKGFIHRDIKPENIIVSDSGVVKLIDLNASRQYVQNAAKDTISLGTLGYASPEQLGIAQSDRRTDIYALGVLLNTMLTGVHPSVCIADGKAKKIIIKCTQINPELRFNSVEELVAEL